jgi:VCBS repeat-containing protein
VKSRGWWKGRSSWLPRAWSRGLLLSCEELDSRVQPSVTSTLANPIFFAPTATDTALVAVQPTGSENAAASRHEIVFVDASVSNYEQLLSDANANGVLYEVFVIGADQDGMELMRSVLAEHPPVDAIHILSHATAGQMRLGSAVLDQASLEIYQQQQWRWGQALADHGDLLFYGCDLAQGEEGRGLLEAIQRWTGADVAASTNLTGSAALGGDWTLEFQIGVIDSFTLASHSSTTWVGLLNTGTAIWSNAGDTSPDVSTWDGSSFGSTGNSATVGQWRNVTQARSPTRIEAIVVGVDSSGVITGQMWNGTTWTALPFTMGTASATTFMSAAVAYESQSGDAIVVWDNGTTGINGLSYRVWNGTSWSAEQTITAPSSTEPLHMRLVSNPVADEMVLVVAPAGNSVDFAIVWNGSSWGNGIVLDDGASGGGGQKTEIAAAYESLSGRAVVVYDADQSGNSQQYRVWNGTSWSDQQTVTPPGGAASGNDVRFASMASDPNSNRIALAIVGSSTTWFAVWDGTTWADKVTATSNASTTSAASAAVAFESVSGNILATYGQSGAALRYRTWSASSGWSAQLSGLASGSTINTVNLYADPYSDRIMLAAQDNANDVHYMEWANGTWGSDNILSTNTGENRYQPFGFFWDLNKAPVLTLSVNSASYTENAAALVLDGSAVLTDATSANFAGGSLTVSFSAGGTADDRLGIRHQGTGAGQIGVSGANVTFGGSTIGTFSGGTDGSTPLVITFNASATPTAVRALVRNITFLNVSENPSTAARTVRFVVDDGDPNGVSAPATLTLNVIAVNDAPVLAVPGSQSTNEDTPRVFSTANGNAITVSDVDAGSGNARITLAVFSGSLTLSQTTGLTFTVGDGTDDATMTFSGNFTNLNAALNGLQYLGNLNFAGVDTLHVTINDLGNSGTGGPQSSSANVSINVSGVNDAPTLTVPAAQSVLEDAALIFSSANGNLVAVADVDAGSNPIRVTLTVSSGRLTLSQTTGLTFSVGNGKGDASMTFTGTLANINAALNGLEYVNAPNVHGDASDTLQITVNDLGNTGSGGALSASGSVAISILGANDAPTISAPASQTVNEDAALAFSSAGGNAITVADVDAGSAPVRVTLTVNNGALTLSQTTGLTFTVGDGTGDATMTFTGALADINAALNGLTYAPHANFSGNSTLQIAVNDLGNSGSGGPLSATHNVNITVSAVNDAPTLGLPGAQSTDEDTALVFSSAGGNLISVSDLDAGAGSVRVSLAVSNGVLTLGQTTALTFSVGDGTGDAAMTFTGTLANINAALNGLRYTPGLNYNGSDTLQVTVNDQGNTGSGGAQSASGNVSLTVNPINDAPAVTLPPSQNIVEDGPVIVFSNSNGNPVIVYDVDAGTGLLQVTLSVSIGKLTLAQTTGLTFSSGDGTQDSTMIFTGTLADINAALDGLRYLPAANYNGSDTLVVTVSDLGNTGAGGTQSTSGSTGISVSSENDAPTLTLPPAQSIDEDASLLFSAANGNAITIDDVDADAGQLQVTLSVASGVLTLSQLAGLAFSAGDGTADATMTFTGTLADINAALNGLRYAPGLDYNGSDTLAVLVNDQGNTGSGGALSASGNVSLTVNPINDAPLLSIPGNQTVNEDANLVFSGAGGNAITLTDVDAGSSPVQVTLTATNGVLTLGSFAGLTFTSGDGSGDATMTFTGTLAAINSALSGLVFRGDAHYNGPAGIGLAVSDLGNTGAGGALTDSKTFAINVNPVNDAPTLTTPGPQSVNEDGVLVFSSSNAISVSDVDADGGFIRITLTVGQGTLTLSQTTGLTFSVGDGTGDANMTFTGTLADINVALNGLRYAPGLNYNGNDTLAVLVNDQGNTGSGGAQSASANIAITVSAVNDAPTLSVPGPQATTEDTALVFSSAGSNAVTFADLDAASSAVRVTLTVTHGTLTLAGIAGLTFLTGDGAGDATMTFTGTLAAVNAALNGLRYVPNLEYNGPDQLVVSIDDQGNTGAGGALTAGATIDIAVGATNDAPVISLPGPQSVNEDASLVLSAGTGNAITISDVDAFGDPVLVTLSVGFGTLTLSGMGGLTFLVGSGTGDATMTFTGSLADVNAALNGLMYAPNTDYNGADTLTIHVSDQGSTGSGGAMTTTRDLALTVSAVNDAPVLTVPGPQATDEDTPLNFSFARGNGISVFDVDAASGLVRVTLSVSSGTLTLANTSGLTFSQGDGTNDAVFTFTGTVADVNAALDGLRYLPNLDFNGADTLLVSVNDLSNTGSGGALSDSASIALAVNAVNDAPTIAVPGPQATNEDTPLVFAAGNLISIADVDAASDRVQVTLNVAYGTLTLASLAGLTFVTGDGTGDRTMTFTGTLADVNAALDGLSYTPSLHYNGPDTLQISLDDLGNTGAGGPLSASASVALTVNAVNDAPTLLLPGPQTMLEDGVLVFSAAQGTRIVVGDVDIASGAMLVTLNASQGRLTLGNTSGLFFIIGDGISDATIIFTGSLADVQAALDGMVYAPDADYNGLASLEITLEDQGNSGSGGPLSVTGSIDITVTAVNDTPVAFDHAFTTDEDNSLTMAAPGLLAGAFDVENDPLQALLVAATSHGTLVLRPDGSFTYTPGANFHGSDSFQYAVTDGQATSATVTVTLTIHSVNDAPEGFAPEFAVLKGGNLLIERPTLLQHVEDVDGDALDYAIVQGPQYGQLVRRADGSLVYMPRGGFVGIDTFQFKAWDGQAYSNPITAHVRVEPALQALPPTTPTNYNLSETNGSSVRGTSEPGLGTSGDSLFNGGAGNSFSFDEDAKISPRVVVLNALDGDSVAKGSSLDPALNRLGGERFGSGYADRNSGAAQTIIGPMPLPSSLTPANVQTLFNHLDVLTEQIQSQTGQRRAQTMVAAGVATTAATGYVLWNLRNFYLLASLLTARPIWRQLDPLAILDVWDKEKKKDKEEERLSKFFD